MSEKDKRVCKFCPKTFSTISNCRMHEKNFHNFVYSKYRCQNCEFTCSLKVELNEHISLNHTSSDLLPVKLTKKILCPTCDKRFTSVYNCKRHQKDVHGLMYSCPKCEFSFCSTDELTQHNIVNHAEKPNSLPFQTQPSYTCPDCKETFSKFVLLIKHKKMQHPSSMQMLCSICKKCFKSSKTFKHHERNIHKKYKIRNFPCSECKIVLDSKHTLYEHIKDIHPNLMKTEENFNFNTWQEFRNWKQEIEKKTLSFYIKKQCSSFTTVFTCHRSGYFKSESKGIRRMKSIGTRKINSYCPASITVKRCTESELLNVVYFPTHLGHNFDVKHVGLDENEKAKIAGQLMTGVPSSLILNEIAKNPLSNERLSVTTAQDVRNVAKKFKIKRSAIRNENLILDFEQVSYAADVIKEKKAIVTEKPQHESLTELRSNAKSLLMNFIPKIDRYSEDQCKVIIKSLILAERECEALKSVENSNKIFPLVASTSSNFKKIKPQRLFPPQKKNSVKKLLSMLQPS